MSTHNVDSAVALLDASPDRLEVFEVPAAAPLSARQGMPLAIGDLVDGLRAHLADIEVTHCHSQAAQ